MSLPCSDAVKVLHDHLDGGDYLISSSSFEEHGEVLSTQQVTLKFRAVVHVTEDGNCIEREPRSLCAVCSRRSTRPADTAGEVDAIIKDHIVGKPWYENTRILVPVNHQTISCGNCDSGYVTCGSCNGRGKQLCGTCNGSGEGTNRTEPCKDCDGTGEVDCRPCWGHGNEDCERCEGSGTLHSYSGFWYQIAPSWSVHGLPKWWEATSESELVKAANLGGWHAHERDGSNSYRLGREPVDAVALELEYNPSLWYSASPYQALVLYENDVPTVVFDPATGPIKQNPFRRLIKRLKAPFGVGNAIRSRVRSWRGGD